jgi:F-type H+-transporting ATPase subunit gamma
MNSIRDTMKITNAMYMISSSKMKHAKSALEETEPYFFEQQDAVANVLMEVPEIDSIYFNRGQHLQENQKRRAYLVITADKGLAGAYNHNVMKMTDALLAQGERNHLYILGELGRQYYEKKNVTIEGHFHYTVQNPTLHRARVVAKRILDDYIDDKIDEVYIVYTKMINAFKMEPQNWKLLPLKRTDFKLKEDSKYREQFQYHPSVEKVLGHLVPNIVTGYIYGALVESYACEQNSRMMAMQSATDSAKDMLRELGIEYNRARQSAITQEITEVIAGAQAQKKK